MRKVKLCLFPIIVPCFELLHIICGVVPTEACTTANVCEPYGSRMWALAKAVKILNIGSRNCLESLDPGA